MAFQPNENIPGNPIKFEDLFTDLQQISYEIENKLDEYVHNINHQLCSYIIINFQQYIDGGKVGIALFTGINLRYLLLGSLYLSHVYNYELLKDINYITRYNPNNNLDINYKYDINLINRPPPINNYKTYIQNNLYQHFKSLNFNRLINSYDYDIHIFMDNLQANRDIDYRNPDNIDSIRTFFDRIGTIIVEDLNTHIQTILFSTSSNPNRNPIPNPHPFNPGGYQNKYYKSIKNMVGGYISFFNIFESLGYTIVTQNGNIFRKSNMLTFPAQKNGFNKQTAFFIRIFYVIAKINNPAIHHQIALFDIAWERKDDDTIPYIAKARLDYSPDNPIVFTNTYLNNIKLGTRPPLPIIENIGSLYDLINNYFMMIQINRPITPTTPHPIGYKKYNKCIFRLYFLLNLLFHPTSKFINKNTLQKINSLDYINQLNELVEQIRIHILALQLSPDPIEQDKYNRFKALYFSINLQNNENNHFVQPINLLKNTKIKFGSNDDDFIRDITLITTPITLPNITDFTNNNSYNAEPNKVFVKYFAKIAKMLNYTRYNTIVNTSPIIPTDDIFNQINFANNEIIGHTYNNFRHIIIPNSITEIQRNYILGLPQTDVRSITYYKSIGYRIINTILFESIFKTDIEIPQYVAGQNVGSIDYSFRLYKLLLQVPNVYPKANNDYLFTKSYRGNLHIKSHYNALINLSIGEEMFLPYIISTSKHSQGVNIFAGEAYHYDLYIIIPTNEKYVFIDSDIPGIDIPQEEEILLPPGFYKFLDSYKDDSSEIPKYIFLYESLKIDFTGLSSDTFLQRRNLLYSLHDNKLKLTFENNYDDATFTRFNIDTEIEQFLPLNKIHDAQKLYLITPYTKPTVILNNYIRSNLSPYNNIFKITSERINIPENYFYGLEINFKTILYSGQRISPESPAYTEEHIYMTNLFTAGSYAFLHYLPHKLTNIIYSIAINGQNRSLKLIDCFNINNLQRIYTYYLAATPAEQRILGIYYRFNQQNRTLQNASSNTRLNQNPDEHPHFYYNGKKIEIEYKGVIFGSRSYNKLSQSTQNDIAMTDILKRIFGNFDGYISKTLPTMHHNWSVIFDEICIFNFKELFRTNTLTLLDPFPTTIDPVNFVITPDPLYSNIRNYIMSSLVLIQQLFLNYKIDKIYESFRYNNFFDKFIISEFNSIEQFFTIIFDYMEPLYNSMFAEVAYQNKTIPEQIILLNNLQPIVQIVPIAPIAPIVPIVLNPNEIKVLSYNIAWEAMTVGMSCPLDVLPNNSTQTQCLNNVSRFIETNGPYDFIGLQESTNFNLIKVTANLQNYRFIFHRERNEEIVTFYDPKYSLDDTLSMIGGNIGRVGRGPPDDHLPLGTKEEGRPILILFFKNNLCVINMHASHKNDINNFLQRLDEILNLWAYSPDKEAYLTKLRTYNLIIMGDLNNELVPNQFLTNTINQIFFDRQINGHNITDKTCCDTTLRDPTKVYRNRFDHILTTYPTINSQVYKPGILHSDHLPVIAVINTTPAVQVGLGNKYYQKYLKYKKKYISLKNL